MGSWTTWWDMARPLHKWLVVCAGALALLVWGLAFLRFATAGSAAGEGSAKHVLEVENPFAEPTSPTVPSASSPSSPVDSSIFAVRDPFRAPAKASPSGSTGIVPDNGVTPTDSVSPTPAPSSETRIKLEGITSNGSTASATILVNGTPYTVSEGEDFGGSFRLLEIGEDRVTILRGDDRIDLALAEEIVK